MADFTSPSEIAREVFRRLTARRIQPTPENFSELYHQISGVPPEEPFPDRHLRQVAAALPRATPEQLRLARQFETAFSEHNWQSFKQQLIVLLSSQETEPLAWAALIRDLQAQSERRQMGLSSVTKHEALNRVLESSASDQEALFSRLQGLVKGWAQLPSAGSNIEVDTESPTPTVTATALTQRTVPTDLTQAPELWRDLIADTLESAVGMLLIDTPELAKEATALAKLLRDPATGESEDFSARLRQFSYKVQWVAQDQSYIRSALLNLLRLIIENIGELVIEDKYLQGQMAVLMELFSRPLDKGVLEELGERLRDVIYKQGTIKRSLNEAQNRLRDMLAHFVERLGELAESTGSYHGKVSAFAEQITKASSLNELAGLVDEIVKETKLVENSARHSQEELQSLRITVDQANKEIARLEGELETASEMVRHDPLTGTLNRKGLDEMLARETARMQRRGSKLSLALLDVDDFKKLNDSLGHTTGDEALKHLALVIRENIRPQDSAGRYGGEEFLILLPDTGLEDGITAMRRLQRELTKRIFLHDNRKVLITFSAGVTEMRPDETVHTAIDRADKAMYKAKNAGKNRVEGN
ncbi:diguanylate cyclase [Uliginosibacterium sp. 31-16]|uniref:GGDEF domain-containing protein n=1 Tax=Uliginosibacterium sp. 31-16 TaxID=3068315 RepID=UPI00273E8676|nr:diguanylate cyclase [Uliginosibacterium sp. 31-16]MDP5238097.1 diguanylate cyclase [Uliginosibacterium sp. 31-16]